MVFSFLPAFEGYNFGKQGGRERKINDVREHDFSFLGQGLYILLLDKIQNTDCTD